MERTAPLVLLGLVLGCSGPDGAAQPAAMFSWTEVAACPVARFEANGVVVGDELWVMGGFVDYDLNVTRRVDIYDPSRNAWRPGPELPGAETHVGVANVNGDVVLVGGFAGNVLDRVTSSGVWRWSAASGAWSAGPELPTARAATAMALVGNEIHAAGGLAPDGDTDSSEHVVWNLAGPGAWTSAAPLPNPRNHGGGAASGGRLFAVAGRHSWDEVTGDEPDVDAFDPAMGTWSKLSPMPLARSEIGSSTSTMADGRLLVVGGSIPGQHPSDDVLIYDPAQDRWSSLLALPVPLKGVVAARIGQKIVVSTGSPTSRDPSATTYVGCCL